MKNLMSTILVAAALATPAVAQVSFLSQQSYNSGDATTAIVAGDFNADQALDLVVANRDDDTIRLLLNSGTGDLRTGDTDRPGAAPDRAGRGAAR